MSARPPRTGSQVRRPINADGTETRAVPEATSPALRSFDENIRRRRAREQVAERAGEQLDREIDPDEEVVRQDGRYRVAPSVIEPIRQEQIQAQEEALRSDIAGQYPWAEESDVRIETVETEEGEQLSAQLDPELVEEHREQQREEIRTSVAEQFGWADPSDVNVETETTEEGDERLVGVVDPDLVEEQRQEQIADLREQIAAAYPEIDEEGVIVEERESGEITARAPEDVVEAEQERQRESLREEIASAYQDLDPSGVIIEQDGDEITGRAPADVVEAARERQEQALREDVASGFPDLDPGGVIIEETDGEITGHAPQDVIDAAEARQRESLREQVAGQAEWADPSDVEIREEDGELLGQIDPDALDEQREEEREEVAETYDAEIDVLDVTEDMLTVEDDTYIIEDDTLIAAYADEWDRREGDLTVEDGRVQVRDSVIYHELDRWFAHINIDGEYVRETDSGIELRDAAFLAEASAETGVPERHLTVEEPGVVSVSQTGRAYAAADILDEQADEIDIGFADIYIDDDRATITDTRLESLVAEEYGYDEQFVTVDDGDVEVVEPYHLLTVAEFSVEGTEDIPLSQIRIGTEDDVIYASDTEQTVHTAFTTGITAGIADVAQDRSGISRTQVAEELSAQTGQEIDVTDIESVTTASEQGYLTGTQEAIDVTLTDEARIEVIAGQTSDVSQSDLAIDADTDEVVVERQDEGWGDLPFTDRSIEGVLRDASSGFSGIVEDVSESPVMTATGAGLTAEWLDQAGFEDIGSGVEEFHEGGFQASAEFLNIPQYGVSAIEIGEYAGYAGEEIAAGRGGISVEATGGGAWRAPVDVTLEEEGLAADTIDAGVQAVSGFVEHAQENPAQTAGMVTGSIAASAAIMGGAAQVSRGAGTVARFAIQPGEEILGRGGFRVTQATAGTASAQRYFPHREPLIFSEEFALRQARRARGRIRTELGPMRRLATGEATLADAPPMTQARVEAVVGRGGRAGTGEIETTVTGRPGSFAGEQVVATEVTASPGRGAVSEPLGSGSADPWRTIDYGTAEGVDPPRPGGVRTEATAPTTGSEPDMASLERIAGETTARQQLDEAAAQFGIDPEASQRRIQELMSGADRGQTTPLLQGGTRAVEPEFGTEQRFTDWGQQDRLAELEARREQFGDVGRGQTTTEQAVRRSQDVGRPEVRIDSEIDQFGTFRTQPGAVVPGDDIYNPELRAIVTQDVRPGAVVGVDSGIVTTETTATQTTGQPVADMPMDGEMPTTYEFELPGIDTELGTELRLDPGLTTDQTTDMRLTTDIEQEQETDTRIANEPRMEQRPEFELETEPEPESEFEAEAFGWDSDDEIRRRTQFAFEEDAAITGTGILSVEEIMDQSSVDFDLEWEDMP